uniref:Short-chain collagen C4 n=1 Tax=Magallana gigas TaxID=29159 RepID=A0A8W8IJR4_MAGGI
MVVWILLIVFLAQAVAEKRILLNDPNLVQSQIHALERKMEDVSLQFTDLSAKYSTLLTKTNAGGIFVRWGRKDCPGNKTELVYSGFAGGSYYRHNGAAAEFVCLPPDPDLTTKYTSSYAYMYGSEYYSNEFGHDGGNDLPCSVCRSTVQSSVLMIPAKSSCYDGWSMQYQGDLVAGYTANEAAKTCGCGSL